jgi:hypothetical protein
MKRTPLIIFVLIAVVLAALALRSCGKGSPATPTPVPITPSTSTVELVVSTPTKVEAPVIKKTPVKMAFPKVVSPEPPAPPPVKIFKELIPKDIDVVRVYYERSLTAPGSEVMFDINGSGFTKEFEQMIKVESGNPDVAIKDLALVTLNQIHGTLVIGEKTATGLSYPQILINGKVVFRAPDPFAVIRPREILNLIFTEMGDNGRTGRFRVFTNLTPDDFTQFQVFASTPAIAVSDLRPNYPFVVDGTLNIGGAPTGNYGLAARLGDKILWAKDEIVRVVKPNIGQSGLAQRLLSAEGFHRPGDEARFILQGSGFQPSDATLLSARVKEWSAIKSTFTFVSPGRLDITLAIPASATPGAYDIDIMHGADVLLTTPHIFNVVGPYWSRDLKLSPNLIPGGKSLLTLSGRDFDKEFIASIKVAVDEPGLTLEPFVWISPFEAASRISADASVAPGDYWLKLSANGKPLTPQFGSIIRVSDK